MWVWGSGTPWARSELRGGSQTQKLLVSTPGFPYKGM